MNAQPFSLRIFVADGDPDGLRLVERSNWVGEALMFPCALLPQVKQRTELSRIGVYLLLGPREDDERGVSYLGGGDHLIFVKTRPMLTLTSSARGHCNGQSCRKSFFLRSKLVT